jgi:Ca-activated chloride channel family protein
MRGAIAALLVALTAAITAAQQTIRVTTRIVPLPTMVTDGQGRLVPDLDKEAFTVLDNGKPQEIVLFENTIQPFTVVVMLDFSASMTSSLDLLKQAAEAFLLRMLPEDKAQVGAFSDRIQFSGTFSNNRDRLIASLRDLDYGNSTKLYDAIDASVSLLEPLEGRRVVLVFTDGDDTDSRISMSKVKERAQRSDIMIYAIGLRSKMLGRPATAPDAGLKKMADATGGGYFELNRTEDLNPTFTRVAQELHSLYTIGFAPQTLDGKEHKLVVRTNQTDQKVRTRNNYLATSDDR